MNFEAIKAWVKSNLILSIYCLVAFLCLIFVSIVAIISFFPWALIGLIVYIAAVAVVTVFWIRKKNEILGLVFAALVTVPMLLTGLMLILLGVGVAHF